MYNAAVAKEKEVKLDEGAATAKLKDDMVAVERDMNALALVPKARRVLEGLNVQRI
mgnify:CR=1 FL=1